MPSMPNITVSDAQLARITAAFPGTTNAEKADAYRAWLKEQLRDYVIRTELRSLDEQNNTAKRNAVDEATAALP